MHLTILKSKIHKAVVTETDIDYVGSITIDLDLMEASGLLSYELVHVWNITNGNRLVTYAIPGERGSGVICLNGAAAHLNRAGDRVIIAAFAEMTPEELKAHKPSIVIVNHDNKIERVI
ncbi:MAG: aspartate 1-decarboxylase [Brevinematales bacterium]|nr:aspartate 1-decarboxylase [Brevinematales bacterium]